MKTLISLLLLLTITTVADAAPDFTYSTSLFYALTYPTNIYIGTNGTDTGGDTFHIWATKINAAENLFWDHFLTDESEISTNTSQLSTIASLQTNTFISVATFKSGTIYPTNIWNLGLITNGILNGGYWIGNSNGAAIVSVFLSNSIPIITQVIPDNLTPSTSNIQTGSTNSTALSAFRATFSTPMVDTNYTAIATGDGFALAAEYVSLKTTTNCQFNMTIASGLIDWLAVHQ